MRKRTLFAPASMALEGNAPSLPTYGIYGTDRAVPSKQGMRFVLGTVVSGLIGSR